MYKADKPITNMLIQLSAHHYRIDSSINHYNFVIYEVILLTSPNFVHKLRKKIKIPTVHNIIMNF